MDLIAHLHDLRITDDPAVERRLLAPATFKKSFVSLLR
jgi:hypothetical protein